MRVFILLVMFIYGANCQILENNKYFIISKHSGKCLEISSLEIGSKLKTSECKEYSELQRFQINNLKSDVYTIGSLGTKKNINLNGVNIFNQEISDEFKIIKLKNNLFKIKSNKIDKYINIRPYTNKVFFYHGNETEDQLWYISDHLPIEGIINDISSCKEILDLGISNGDGLYTIIINQEPVDVYCDMTRDGGGWTLILKAQRGSTEHSNSNSIGKLVNPNQTSIAKLSDYQINSIPKSIYRVTSNNEKSSIYFDTSDNFASDRIVQNKASKVYPPFWEGPYINGTHRGFNTHVPGRGSFGRNDSFGVTFTGGSNSDSCRLGVTFTEIIETHWCGQGDSSTIWLK